MRYELSRELNKRESSIDFEKMKRSSVWAYAKHSIVCIWEIGLGHAAFQNEQSWVWLLIYTDSNRDLKSMIINLKLLQKATGSH